MGKGKSNGGALLGDLPLWNNALDLWAESWACGDGKLGEVSFVCEVGRHRWVQEGAAKGKWTMCSDEKISVEIPRDPSTAQADKGLVVLVSQVTQTKEG